MNLNRSNLINHFKGIHIHHEDVIFDEETLNSIHTNFNQAIETRPCDIVIDKSYGIFAVIDTALNEYRVVSFHYVDFTWFQEEEVMKIMHKAGVAQWKNNSSLFKFSESPLSYSGDVCGIMRGDFRECFDAIKEKEEAIQLLHKGSIELPNDRKKINIQCGVGLESLTIIEKCTKENHPYVDLTYVF